jgi:predicted thioesterase
MKIYSQQHLITESETAAVMGSGNLEVYATPAMIALMENTAVQAIDNIETGFTTVGIEINVRHLKASKPGETVICTAELIKQEGKLYEFQIVVENANGDKTGTATHKRVAVRIDKFMNSL